MKLYIKNMVCNRCKMVVATELEKLGLHPQSVDLGEVTLQEDELPAATREHLQQQLQSLGFELIDDKRRRIIEKIKNIIINRVHHQDDTPDDDANLKLSELLRRELHHDYNYLSNLFSDVEGIPIEKYYIAQKIERVKELLVYDELSLSEIAFRMNYSSTAYLSNQFKKTTGLTPSHFKKIKENKRKPLDEV